RLPLAADSLDHAARFLRHVLLVGDSPAADLRAGHPAGWPQGLRMALCRTRRWRDDDEHGDGAADEPHQAPRAGAALGGRPVWLRDRGVRSVAFVLDHLRRAGPD